MGVVDLEATVVVGVAMVADVKHEAASAQSNFIFWKSRVESVLKGVRSTSIVPFFKGIKIMFVQGKTINLRH